MGAMKQMFQEQVESGLGDTFPAMEYAVIIGGRIVDVYEYEWEARRHARFSFDNAVAVRGGSENVADISVVPFMQFPAETFNGDPLAIM